MVLNCCFSLSHDLFLKTRNSSTLQAHENEWKNWFMFWYQTIWFLESIVTHSVIKFVSSFENPTVIQNEKNRLLSVTLAKSLNLKKPCSFLFFKIGIITSHYFQTRVSQRMIVHKILRAGSFLPFPISVLRHHKTITKQRTIPLGVFIYEGKNSNIILMKPSKMTCQHYMSLKW